MLGVVLFEERNLALMICACFFVARSERLIAINVDIFVGKQHPQKLNPERGGVSPSSGLIVSRLLAAWLCKIAWLLVSWVAQVSCGSSFSLIASLFLVPLLVVSRVDC